MKRLGVILLFVALAATTYIFYLRPSDKTVSCQTNPSLTTKQLSGNSHTLTAELADENAEQIRGLSGRDCLSKDRAMLFSYELAGDYCFWMKDMKFSIDMIWLDDEKKVVTIKQNVSPNTYPQTFCPDKPAQYIVEVDEGRAAELGWAVGTVLAF